MTELLPGERLYQQFAVDIKWSEPIGDHTDPAPWQTKGLPPARIWNGIHPYKMFRENATLEQAEQWAEGYAREYLQRRVDTADVTVNVAYRQSEVWLITWFSHYTFDVGLADTEVLESFERFVRRMEDRNRREGYHDQDGYWREPYCLMGAEDRYRWRARQPDGDDGPAPCRCKHCKKHGVVRIDH